MLNHLDGSEKAYVIDEIEYNCKTKSELESVPAKCRDSYSSYRACAWDESLGTIGCVLCAKYLEDFQACKNECKETGQELLETALQIRIIVASFALTLFGVLMPSHPVWCEYEPYKLGKALGMYIAAVSVMEEFGSSQCGYLLGEEFNPREVARRESKYLNEADREEFLRYMESEEWKRERIENRQFIQTYLERLKKEELTTKGRCSLLHGVVSGVLTTGEEEWRYAIRNFSK